MNRSINRKVKTGKFEESKVKATSFKRGMKRMWVFTKEIVAGGLRNHKRRKQLGKRERLGRAERCIWERSKREEDK